MRFMQVGFNVKLRSCEVAGIVDVGCILREAAFHELNVCMAELAVSDVCLQADRWPLMMASAGPYC